MLRFRLAAALVAVAMSGLASAADSPLSAFSSDADVVVRIKAPKATIDKTASLIEAIQPGFGAMVRQNAVALGALIGNPTLAGVDQSKDWYIGVFTNGQEEASVVFGVPVTDAAAAQQAVGESMKSKAHGSWLFYSSDEEVLPASGKVDAAIESVMKGEAAAVFDRGDVAVFVNLAHLVKEYGEIMTAGVEQAKETMKQLPPQPGVDPEAMQKVYADMIDYVMQGVKDSVQVTLALNIGAEGISGEDYLSFAPQSATAKLLGGQTASAMAIASKMPADAVMIFGASGDTNKMLEWAMSMSKTMAPKEPKAQKAFEEFTQNISKFKFGAMVGALSLQKSDKGLFKNTVVMEVSPAQQYKELARKMAGNMGTVETGGLKQETKVEVDAESYGSVKADVVTIKQEFDDSADPTGAARQMQSLMFGEGGIQTRVVYQQDRIIQTMGGGKEAMQEALKALESSNASDSVTKYRNGLIEKPNFLVLVDVPGLVVQGLRVASAIPNMPATFNAEMLDSLKFDKSYMGFTAAAEKDAVRAKSRIPVEQLRALFSLAMTAQTMQQNNN